MSPDSIPRQVVNAALRAKHPFFGIACVVLVAGVSSVFLARLRFRDRLLFWLGIFSILYAIRLFIQNELVRAALNAPGQEFSARALCLTYVIPIPYALFARELFGRGWKEVITVWLWIQVAFAIAAIPTALVAHQVHWTDSLNGILAMGGTLLILLPVLFRPEGSNAFARSLTWPLLVSGILVVLQNRGVKAGGSRY